MVKRDMQIAAAAAAAGVAITVVGTIAIVHHMRKRKKRKGQFLPAKKRKVITDMLEGAAEDIPHGPVAASLYHYRLQSLSDRRLLVLYAALKIGEYMRDNGIDPAQATAEQLDAIKTRFAKATDEGEQDRSVMLDKLLAFDAADVKPLLTTALGILALL